jgi:hypothetical protein
LVYQNAIKINQKMTTIKTGAEESQLEKANAILNELRPNVTSKDREDAQKKLDLSAPTVNRYLLGEAKNIDTAIRLIQFFKKRIEDRERELAA